MRLASIDLGTNTVRLLIVDVDGRGEWHPIAEDQRVTRLGEGLASSGSLSADAMARTAGVVKAYVERARALGAAEVRIVATSAVREALNGPLFASLIERESGCAVTVVSGDDEARLTLAGVLRGLPPTAGSTVIFDIGGGSTEYIRIQDREPSSSVSLKLGVVALAERFRFPEPVDWDQYDALAREVRRRLGEELPEELRAPVDRLVGTAGTITTVAALDLNLSRYDGERVQGHVLDRDAVDRVLRRLGALTVAARAALPCLDPGRADLMIPGIAIVLETMTILRCERLVVSDFGLREGLLSDLIDRRR